MFPGVRLALASLSATLGLAWWAAPTPPRIYDVEISPQFTAAESAAVVRAARDWEAVTPGLWMHMLPVGAPLEPRAALIVVAPASPAWLAERMGHPIPDVLGCTWRDDAAPTTPWQVRLDVRDPDPRFNYTLESVAAHELGHAMGLHHSPRHGALMYPYADSQALAPTVWDVAAWVALRVR